MSLMLHPFIAIPPKGTQSSLMPTCDENFLRLHSQGPEWGHRAPIECFYGVAGREALHLGHWVLPLGTE